MAPTNGNGELRGSSPILTAKDVLLEVRDDVKAMRGEFTAVSSKVDILTSQNLNERVARLEQFQWKVVGIAIAGAFLASQFGNAINFAKTVATGQP